ncbi:hypothetical protein HW511_08080 [Asaia siamensis]|uniref:Immunity protein 45 domain-containing protein n=1 Tax=Asaia siamensis TaxID=110479 RepID=A0ABQ1LV50_9PROT|nr:hypothetical protein AA0323_0554 [Asaia siamensis NRIC 0323]GGC29084.1 hypothetical protein GCM10007207_13180 [Asaia siamensis]
MNNFTKITLLKRDFVSSGCVFRLPARYPYESIVDFMLCRVPSSDSYFGLIVTTGYKAGIIFQLLPAECLHDSAAVSLSWIKDNWNKWIYEDCSIDEVLFSEGYLAEPDQGTSEG